MGKNTARKIFTANGTFTAPAGCKKVRIVTKKKQDSFSGSGGDETLALSPDGSLYTWGVNTSGQLGLGDVVSRSSPVAALGGLKFKSVSSISDGFNFGITDNGSAYAWGLNTNGNLGVGDVIPRSSPVLILGGHQFSKIISIKQNPPPVLGLGENGNLFAWGINANGELGLGDVTPRSAPVAVLGGLTFSDIYAGYTSTCALTKNGTAYTWGLNTNGQLGVGDVTPRSSPVAVLGGLTFVDVASSSTSRVFLTSAGAAYACGLNANGQLGVGDVTPRSSPVAVLGGLTFAKIYSGFGESFFGITPDGVAYAWGLNTNGQLGVGDVTPRSSPVAVLGGLTFAKIMTEQPGAYFSLGLTTSGALYGWGLELNGALGNGALTPRSSPVAVAGGLTFTDFFNGVSSIFAITNEGQLYAWGTNSRGQLGHGNVTPKSSPVIVLGDILLRSIDDIQISDITVTPNTTYTISIQQYSATFENTIVGKGKVDSLTVFYDN